MNDHKLPAADEPTSRGTTGSPAPRHIGLRVFVMIVAGAVAAAASLAAISGLGEVYQVPAKYKNLPGGNVPAELQAEADAARLAARRGNAALWLGVTGAILGGLLPLTMGWLRGAGRRSLLGMVVGIVLGGGLGMLAGCWATTTHQSLVSRLSGTDAIPDHQVMLMHGVTWGLIGLGVGLACGLSSPSIRFKSVFTSIIVAGALGCLAGVAFPFVAGVKAPLVNSALPIPEPGQGQVIWIALSSLLMGIGLGRAG